MRSGVGTLLALTVLLVGAGHSPGQRILEENPYYLRSDPRLQVTLNVEPEHPKLAQIVASLRDATGLGLTVDTSLDGHQPDYGVILPSKRGYHAWQLMEMVAGRGMESGYWEKTDQGYRLIGISSLPADKLGPDKDAGALTVWLAVTGGVFLAVAVALLALRKRRGRSA